MPPKPNNLKYQTREEALSGAFHEYLIFEEEAVVNSLGKLEFGLLNKDVLNILEDEITASTNAGIRTLNTYITNGQFDRFVEEATKGANRVDFEELLRTKVATELGVTNQSLTDLEGAVVGKYNEFIKNNPLDKVRLRGGGSAYATNTFRSTEEEAEDDTATQAHALDNRPISTVEKVDYNYLWGKLAATPVRLNDFVWVDAVGQRQQLFSGNKVVKFGELTEDQVMQLLTTVDGYDQKPGLLMLPKNIMVQYEEIQAKTDKVFRGHARFASLPRLEKRKDKAAAAGKTRRQRRLEQRENGRIVLSAAKLFGNPGINQSYLNKFNAYMSGLKINDKTKTVMRQPSVLVAGINDKLVDPSMQRIKKLDLQFMLHEMFDVFYLKFQELTGSSGAIDQISGQDYASIRSAFDRFFLQRQVGFMTKEIPFPGLKNFETILMRLQSDPAYADIQLDDLNDMDPVNYQDDLRAMLEVDWSVRKEMADFFKLLETGDLLSTQDKDAIANYLRDEHPYTSKILANDALKEAGDINTMLSPNMIKLMKAIASKPKYKKYMKHLRTMQDPAIELKEKVLLPVLIEELKDFRAKNQPAVDRHRSMKSYKEYKRVFKDKGINIDGKFSMDNIEQTALKIGEDLFGVMGIMLPKDTEILPLFFGNDYSPNVQTLMSDVFTGDGMGSFKAASGQIDKMLSKCNLIEKSDLANIPAEEKAFLEKAQKEQLDLLQNLTASVPKTGKWSVSEEEFMKEVFLSVPSELIDQETGAVPDVVEAFLDQAREKRHLALTWDEYVGSVGLFGQMQIQAFSFLNSLPFDWKDMMPSLVTWFNKAGDGSTPLAQKIWTKERSGEQADSAEEYTKNWRYEDYIRAANENTTKLTTIGFPVNIRVYDGGVMTEYMIKDGVRSTSFGTEAEADYNKSPEHARALNTTEQQLSNMLSTTEMRPFLKAGLDFETLALLQSTKDGLGNEPLYKYAKINSANQVTFHSDVEHKKILSISGSTAAATDISLDNNLDSAKAVHTAVAALAERQVKGLEEVKDFNNIMANIRSGPALYKAIKLGGDIDLLLNKVPYPTPDDQLFTEDECDEHFQDIKYFLQQFYVTQRQHGGALRMESTKGKLGRGHTRLFTRWLNQGNSFTAELSSGKNVVGKVNVTRTQELRDSENNAKTNFSKWLALLPIKLATTFFTLVPPQKWASTLTELWFLPWTGGYAVMKKAIETGKDFPTSVPESVRKALRHAISSEGMWQAFVWIMFGEAAGVTGELAKKLKSAKDNPNAIKDLFKNAGQRVKDTGHKVWEVASDKLGLDEAFGVHGPDGRVSMYSSKNYDQNSPDLKAKYVPKAAQQEYLLTDGAGRAYQDWTSVFTMMDRETRVQDGFNTSIPPDFTTPEFKTLFSGGARFDSTNGAPTLNLLPLSVRDRSLSGALRGPSRASSVFFVDQIHQNRVYQKVTVGGVSTYELWMGDNKSLGEHEFLDGGATTLDGVVLDPTTGYPTVFPSGTPMEYKMELDLTGPELKELSELYLDVDMSIDFTAQYDASAAYMRKPKMVTAGLWNQMVQTVGTAADKTGITTALTGLGLPIDGATKALMIEGAATGKGDSTMSFNRMIEILTEPPVTPPNKPKGTMRERDYAIRFYRTYFRPRPVDDKTPSRARNMMAFFKEINKHSWELRNFLGGGAIPEYLLRTMASNPNPKLQITPDGYGMPMIDFGGQVQYGTQAWFHENGFNGLQKALIEAIKDGKFEIDGNIQ